MILWRWIGMNDIEELSKRVETLETQIKELSKRVEILEKQKIEDREEQISKLEAELNYEKFRCALSENKKALEEYVKWMAESEEV